MATAWNDQRGVTVWGQPKERINSAYGPINFEDWCRLEAERLNHRHHRPVRVAHGTEKHEGMVRIERV